MPNNTIINIQEGHQDGQFTVLTSPNTIFHFSHKMVSIPNLIVAYADIEEIWHVLSETNVGETILLRTFAFLVEQSDGGAVPITDLDIDNPYPFVQTVTDNLTPRPGRIVPRAETQWTAGLTNSSSRYGAFETAPALPFTETLERVTEIRTWEDGDIVFITLAPLNLRFDSPATARWMVIPITLINEDINDIAGLEDLAERFNDAVGGHQPVVTLLGERFPIRIMAEGELRPYNAGEWEQLLSLRPTSTQPESFFNSMHEFHSFNQGTPNEVMAVKQGDQLFFYHLLKRKYFIVSSSRVNEDIVTLSGIQRTVSDFIRILRIPFDLICVGNTTILITDMGHIPNHHPQVQRAVARVEIERRWLDPLNQTTGNQSSPHAGQSAFSDTVQRVRGTNARLAMEGAQRKPYLIILEKQEVVEMYLERDTQLPEADDETSYLITSHINLKSPKKPAPFVIDKEDFGRLVEIGIWKDESNVEK